MGWAQTVTLPKPGNKKGTATIFCSTNTKGKAPAPFVTSVAAGAVHMTTTKTKPEVSAEFPTPHSATPAKLTVTPQSQTTQDYWTSAPLDPDPVFEVLLPGGEADLNTYLTAYIAEVAEVLEVPADGLANDFQGAYGYALNPAIGNSFAGSVYPPTLHLDDGGSATITLTLANSSDLPMATLLAIRATDQTGVSAVSDLIAVNMPQLVP